MAGVNGIRAVGRLVARRLASARPQVRAFQALATPRAGEWPRSKSFQRMLFSTEGTNEVVPALSESEFTRYSDATLNAILELMDGIEAILPDADITLSQGVLTINLGEDGTWVLNKQGPNRQIWWSSPISGPKRFEYDIQSGKWLNTRDSSIELVELLSLEIEELTGIIVVTE
ncbi:hypothetical protein AC1031_008093 [Aphanomyces cochlioides]|nr:hypothetical protein AC1031_008093 [Aphanomyces cochlioides]